MLAVSYKMELRPIIRSSHCIPWHLPKWVENLCSHKSLNIDVYRSFIHNCQILEATKMPFIGWKDKFVVVDPGNGILCSPSSKCSYPVMKGKGGTLNAYYLSEISHSGKVTYYIIPTLKQSREAKTMETVRRSAAGKVDEQVEHRGFLGQWNCSVDTITGGSMSLHISQMYATPRANPRVNHGLWVKMMCQRSFISYSKCSSGTRCW